MLEMRAVDEPIRFLLRLPALAPETKARKVRITEDDVFKERNPRKWETFSK